MHGVEAEAIEVVFSEPVKRIVDKEITHDAAGWSVKVDGVSPRRVVTVGEELGCVRVKVISFGAEVVIHDVEKNHQPLSVGSLHELLEVFGTAVSTVGRERQNAV